MTNRSAADRRQIAPQESARDEALKRRSGALREALGMGLKPNANTERPAKQGTTDKSDEPALS
jgi:hypothetical protein